MSEYDWNALWGFLAALGTGVCILYVLARLGREAREREEALAREEAREREEALAREEARDVYRSLKALPVRKRNIRPRHIRRRMRIF